MQESVAGRIVLVTGATRGIGRAIADRLLAEGARVAICGRSRESVDRTLSEMSRDAADRVAGWPADVSTPDAVRDLFQKVDERYGGLDVLINNAGVGIFRSVAEMTPADWHRNIDLNLNGPFYCAHEALHRFRNRGGGYIINISSLAGKNPFAGGAAYNASKFGLNGFSEAMMLDHRYENVRVSYIMPGSVATEFGAGSVPSDWKIAPEDIAEVVSMLLRMPARTTVSRIEIRPSKPKK